MRFFVLLTFVFLLSFSSPLIHSSHADDSEIISDERVEALLDALMLIASETDSFDFSHDFKPSALSPSRKEPAQVYPPSPSQITPSRPSPKPSTPQKTPAYPKRTQSYPTPSASSPSQAAPSNSLLGSLTPQVLRAWIDSISRRLPNSGALYGCLSAWKGRLEWIIMSDLRGEKIGIMDLLQVFFDYRTSAEFQPCRNLGLSRLLDFEMPKQLKQMLSGEMEYYKLLLLQYLERSLAPQAEKRSNSRGYGSR